MSYHTMAEAREVLAETARILEADRAKKVSARAHAGSQTSRPDRPRGGQTATARWNEAISAKMATGLPKAKAVRAVAIADPDLHRDYLSEFNAKASEVERLGRKQAEIGRQIAARR